MLLYILFMLAIAFFFHKESKKLLQGSSHLLQEYCTDPASAKKALSLLRRVLLSSAASAALMTVCFVITKLTGAMPKPVAALSIFCYTAGFISAMLRLKNL